MLLRYYDHEDSRVRTAVHGCLVEIFGSPPEKSNHVEHGALEPQYQEGGPIISW